jgi:hypothetical protein
MKSKLIVTLILFAITFFAWMATEDPQKSKLSDDGVNPEKRRMAEALNSNYKNSPAFDANKSVGRYDAPITFYGLVLDQRGNPIPDAVIAYQAHNSPTSTGAKNELRSAEDGRFSIVGERGLSLYVSVSKIGYRPFQDEASRSKTARSFGFGVNLGGGTHKPDQAKPEIFELQKIGKLEPLVVLPERDFRIPSDGTVRSFSLHPDRANEYMVQFLCMSEASKAELNQPYNWRCELTVQGGGVFEAKGMDGFEAPEDGYRSIDIVTMTDKMSRSKWKDRFQKYYFIKFDDGVFARLSVRMYAGKNPSIVVQSWLNPKPGSRNLEPTHEREKSQ